jgi:hypothetical protein
VYPPARWARVAGIGAGAHCPCGGAADDGAGRPGEELLHATDHELRLERFCQHAIAAGFGRACLVDRLERAGQQHHRNVRQPRRLLDELRHFIAVTARHPDVGEHDVGRRRLQTLNRLLAVADRGHLDVLVGERQLDDALNRDAVVGQEEVYGTLVLSDE